MTSPSSQDLYSFLKDRGLTHSSPSKDDRSDETSNEGSGSRSFLDFDNDDIGEKLHEADRDQLNSADFGIVKVDDEGYVEFYNRYESGLSGVAPEDAQGRNFFTHLAPCSNNRIFQGRFKKGVQSGSMDERFTYTFTYKMRPTLVDVRLYRDAQNNNWVMVQKR
ncbi:phosphonate transporter [Longibacter salinarum]|uniref:Phosphonate transporter n=1 Tax=Longibacter salinarum TaxID=1850348 RepID=A0A2A8D0Y3_9BACT|nr:PAS domain-containing protein [Longibacter salinarum]PEN14586.1 phosphonate transporter [Longibacter salinarum]